MSHSPPLVSLFTTSLPSLKTLRYTEKPRLSRLTGWDGCSVVSWLLGMDASSQRALPCLCWLAISCLAQVSWHIEVRDLWASGTPVCDPRAACHPWHPFLWATGRETTSSLVVNKCCQLLWHFWGSVMTQAFRRSSWPLGVNGMVKCNARWIRKFQAQAGIYSQFTQGGEHMTEFRGLVQNLRTLSCDSAWAMHAVGLMGDQDMGVAKNGLQTFTTASRKRTWSHLKLMAG